MYTKLQCLAGLVGAELKSIDRDFDRSVITFDDRSSILVFSDWHWLVGGRCIPGDLGAERLLQKLEPDSPSLPRVSGINIVLRSLKLSIHLHGRWTLQIQPQDPTSVAWVACISPRRIVSAGCGKLTFYEKS